MLPKKSFEGRYYNNKRFLKLTIIAENGEPEGLGTVCEPLATISIFIILIMDMNVRMIKKCLFFSLKVHYIYDSNCKDLAVAEAR